LQNLIPPRFSSLIKARTQSLATILNQKRGGVPASHDNINAQRCSVRPSETTNGRWIFDIVARNGVCAAASLVADFQDYNLDRRRGAP
jgi:hypothetical protein